MSPNLTKPLHLSATLQLEISIFCSISETPNPQKSTKATEASPNVEKSMNTLNMAILNEPLQTNHEHHHSNQSLVQKV